jgi:hypothetical protein
LAECVDGIDLSRRRVGDVFDVSRRDAAILIAEGWAVLPRSHAAPETWNDIYRTRAKSKKKGELSSLP